MIKTHLKILSAAAFAARAAFCGEPLCWERRPNRPAPAQFDTYHGEALEFRCTFAGFGTLPFAEGADVRLWYQTNGMGAAWWSVPATMASNTVSATFPPLADPGADRMVVFFGAPSNAYAAAQVRFRNSPGAHPNDLEPPAVLDWQAELAAATNGLASALTGGSLKVAKAETADSAAYAESASEAGWAAEAAQAYKANDAEYIYKEIDQISGGGNTERNTLRFSYDDIANIKMTADAASNGVDAINNALPTNVAAIVTNSHAVVESWTFSGASYDPGAAYSVNVIPQGNGLYKYELSTNGIFVCYAAFGKYDDPYLTDYPYYTHVYFLWGLDDDEIIADAGSYHMVNDLGLATTNYTDAAIAAATNALGMELRAEMGTDIGALRDDLTTGAVEVASAKRAYEIDTTNGVFGGDWIVDSINELKGGERLTTNNVCNIVTATVEKVVDRWSATTNDAPVLGSAVKFIYQRDANRDLTYRDIYVYFPGYVPPAGYFDAGDMQRVMFHQFNQFAGVHTNDVDVTFTISLSNIPTEEYRYLSGATARLSRITSINALGLARLIDIPTNHVTQAEMQEAIDGIEIPDVSGLATKAALEAVSNDAQVVYRLFSGSNVVDEVTNYNSQVRLPSRRLYQLDTNGYHMVWNELDQHSNTLAQAKAYADDLGTNYAPRAWSRTTSGLGAEAPTNTTWLSTPTTVIAGGFEPSKFITSGGAIWLITSNGMAVDFSPATNNTASLNIAAQDGTPIFRIEKTDSYLLGVNPSAIEVENDTMYVDVNIAASSHPFVRVCEHLGDGWQKEEDGISASLATVNWTPTANGYRCELTNNTGGSSLFAYFEYLQEGSVKIVNGGLLDISGGIIVNGTIYSRIGTATISGHTVLTLEP